MISERQRHRIRYQRLRHRTLRSDSLLEGRRLAQVRFFILDRCYQTVLNLSLDFHPHIGDSISIGDNVIEKQWGTIYLLNAQFFTT